MDYQARLGRLRQRMQEHDVAVIFLPVSSTLEYFTGIRSPIPNPTGHDRPGDWVSGAYIGDSGELIMVEPRMGSDGMVRQVQDKPWITDLRILGEPEDYQLAMTETVQHLRGKRNGSVAIGEHAWAKSAIALGSAAPDAEIVNAHDLIWPLRMIKDQEELDLMRAAAAIADQAFERILPQLALGMGIPDITRLVDDALYALGADWVSFHTGLYIGPPAAGDAPSAIIAQDRTLERGGSIAFDFGALKDGYCSDFGRTVFIGEPSPERRKIHDLVIEAQSAAIGRMIDGEITCRQLDEVARSIIVDAGYGPRFIHRLGHAIGKDVHEPPFLLEGDDTALRSGMCFTIEPSVDCADGAFIRVEDVVLVTPEGGENLNHTGHDLWIVDL